MEAKKTPSEQADLAPSQLNIDEQMPSKEINMKAEGH